MGIAKRVKEKRIALGLTQVELASRVGISQQSLQKIEDGHTQNPRKLLNLAKALNCQADWLLNGHEDEVREVSSHYQKRIERPLLDAAQLLRSHNLEETLATAKQLFEAPEAASSKAFWYKVIGDSMSNQTGLSIPDGYLVLIEPGLQPTHGSFVLARINKAKEVTFKQLVMDAGQSYLKPLNGHYLPVTLSRDDEIIGVAREVKRSLID
ncbi:LexA family transcriptional regulator [Marinomonas sp. THO17]|uniref:LexA family protein n=1 Tax=Marinomonas sp. THO17 TaxID=3149048 RepID=UPI00336BE992